MYHICLYQFLVIFSFVDGPYSNLWNLSVILIIHLFDVGDNNSYLSIILAVYGARTCTLLALYGSMKLHHYGDFWFKKWIWFWVPKSPKWCRPCGHKLPGYGHFWIFCLRSFFLFHLKQIEWYYSFVF